MKSSAGSVSAYSQSVAVFERQTGAFVSILGGDGNSTGILFGNAGDALSGGIVHDQASVGSETMQFRTGGNLTRMTIRDDGKVGIGTTNPVFLLHVNGSAGKPGGGSWSVASDARLKRNVQDLEGALATLLALRGVTYEYADPGTIGELPGERIGMIAQEVERVVPDWVETGADGYKRLSISRSAASRPWRSWPCASCTPRRTPCAARSSSCKSASNAWKGRVHADLRPAPDADVPGGRRGRRLGGNAELEHGGPAEALDQEPLAARIPGVLPPPCASPCARSPCSSRATASRNRTSMRSSSTRCATSGR